MNVPAALAHAGSIRGVGLKKGWLRRLFNRLIVRMQCLSVTSMCRGVGEFLTNSVGALFLVRVAGRCRSCLYASAYYNDDTSASDAIALVPVDKLEVWGDFQDLCRRDCYNLERSQKVYIIGGTEKSFEPTVDWERVILSDLH